MITICIPTYNFDASRLISELSKQMDDLSALCEMIVIDDGSTQFKAVNRKAAQDHTFIDLSQNIGRSKIRNLFLKYAKYPYLLFLDCDSLVYQTDFLLRYIRCIQQAPSVVCGGRVYESDRPNRAQLLRWKYGVLRESQPCAVRRASPNQSFMTNNFLVKKEILADNLFEERIVAYGHEDTLFGLALKKKGIVITHIENPVVNGDVETNIEFLRKTKEGVVNLVNILGFKEYDIDLKNEITILKFYNRVESITWLIDLSFKVLKPIVFFLLSSGIVNMYLFDYYKLGILVDNLGKKRLGKSN